MKVSFKKLFGSFSIALFSLLSMMGIQSAEATRAPRTTTVSQAKRSTRPSPAVGATTTGIQKRAVRQAPPPRTRQAITSKRTQPTRTPSTSPRAPQRTAVRTKAPERAVVPSVPQRGRAPMALPSQNRVRATTPPPVVKRAAVPTRAPMKSRPATAPAPRARSAPPAPSQVRATTTPRTNRNAPVAAPVRSRSVTAPATRANTTAPLSTPRATTTPPANGRPPVVAPVQTRPSTAPSLRKAHSPATPPVNSTRAITPPSIQPISNNRVLPRTSTAAPERLASPLTKPQVIPEAQRRIPTTQSNQQPSRPSANAEPVRERERLATAERERLATVERDRQATVERERLVAAERERLATVERERLATVERDRQATVERERLATAERDRVATAERERLAAVERDRQAEIATYRQFLQARFTKHEMGPNNGVYRIRIDITDPNAVTLALNAVPIVVATAHANAMQLARAALVGTPDQVATALKKRSFLQALRTLGLDPATLTAGIGEEYAPSYNLGFGAQRERTRQYADFHLPTAPIFHPYNLALDNQEGWQTPAYSLNLKFPKFNPAFAPEALRANLQRLGIRPENVECFLEVQDMPWYRDPLVFRPQYFYDPLAPEDSGEAYLKTFNVQTGVFSKSGAGPRLVRQDPNGLIAEVQTTHNGRLHFENPALGLTELQKNIVRRAQANQALTVPEGNWLRTAGWRREFPTIIGAERRVVSSGNSPALDTVDYTTSRLLHSLVTAEVAGQRKTAHTMHVIWNDEDQQVWNGWLRAANTMEDVMTAIVQETARPVAQKRLSPGGRAIIEELSQIFPQ